MSENTDALHAAALRSPAIGLGTGNLTFDVMCELGITAQYAPTAAELHRAGIAGAAVVVITPKLAEEAYEDFGAYPFGEAAVILVGGASHSMWQAARKVWATDVVTVTADFTTGQIADKLRGLIEFHTSN